MTVEHAHSPVLQQDEYYPFGLTFNSTLRENSVHNELKYKGKEAQSELNIGWYDFGARMYNPELGRWNSIDPLSEKMRKLSPYVYGGDNPIKHIDPDGMYFRIFGEKDDKKQVRQWLREIKGSGEEGRQAVRSLRWSLHRHNVYAMRVNMTGTHGKSNAELTSKANGTEERDSQIAISQNLNIDRMKKGRSAVDSQYIDETAGGGRPSVINNSLAGILRRTMTHTNAYNGKGTGSSMFINLASTTYGTFAHELGHQNSANAGTMDINALKLALQGNTADWIRIKDETAADDFANKVTGSYNGYHFSKEDQMAYDNAVQNFDR